MAARVATWLAIAVGGTAGAWAALASSGSAPAASAAPSVSLPMRPLGAIAANAAESPSAMAMPTSAASSMGAIAPTAALSAADPAPSASGSMKPAAPPPAADLLPLPTTKEKLLRQEMNCDLRKAEACIVAARSYESGSAGLTDPEKAAKYRRIAITAWISQCDHNSALACATLATMYRAGSGVPQSDRNADALFARAHELCRFNDAPICHELPNP
jgi:TPR repeat protein